MSNVEHLYMRTESERVGSNNENTFQLTQLPESCFQYSAIHRDRMSWNDKIWHKQHFAQLPNYMSHSDIYLLLKLHIKSKYIYTHTGTVDMVDTQRTRVFLLLRFIFLLFFIFFYIHFNVSFYTLHVVNLETPKHERHIVVIIIIIVCLDEFQANAFSKQKVLTRMHTLCSVFWIIY